VRFVNEFLAGEKNFTPLRKQICNNGDVDLFY